MLLAQGSSQNVAWLDITMNSGNSGGLVIMKNENPDNDKIIGIAAFNLNPFAADADNLLNQVFSFPDINVAVSGVDIKYFAFITARALKKNSLGIGGCISINHLKKTKIIKNLHQLTRAN